MPMITEEDGTRLFICFPKYNKLVVFDTEEDFDRAQRLLSAQLLSLSSNGIPKTKIEEAQRFLALEKEAANRAYADRGSIQSYLGKDGRVFMFVDSYAEEEKAGYKS